MSDSRTSAAARRAARETVEALARVLSDTEFRAGALEVAARIAPADPAIAAALERYRAAVRRVRAAYAERGVLPAVEAVRRTWRLRLARAVVRRPTRPYRPVVAPQPARRVTSRPRERRLASRARGARAPGRPSGDDGGGDPPLRRCAACGEPYLPRRADARYCPRPECRRARATARQRAHRARLSLPPWAHAEARAVALVRLGAAAPEQALLGLVAGLTRRQLLSAVGSAA